MKNSHYTPSYDSFHEGFNFQKLEDGKWENYFAEFNNVNLKEDLENNNIRVEYLKVDDILNQGFKLKSESKNGTEFYRIPDLRNKDDVFLYMTHVGDEPFVSIVKNGQSLLVDMNIKNCNELEFVLNRLNL